MTTAILLSVVIAVLVLLRLRPSLRSSGQDVNTMGAKPSDPNGVGAIQVSREQATQDLQAYVSGVVAQGFDSDAEIAEFAAEFAEDEYEDHDLNDEIAKMVRSAIANQRASEKSWLEVTDCDRLDRAFATLQARGVVARQNFTCCQNCGHAEIGDEILAEQKHRIVSGYTFFHQQDTESAAEGYGLCLAYGSLSGQESESLAVAEQIVDCLNEEGLETIWNGDLSKRIQVKLNWQKRYPH